MQQFVKLAQNLIGDGKTPNMFFVFHNGELELITPSIVIAYRHYKSLPKYVDKSLEDRLNGIIADAYKSEGCEYTLGEWFFQDDAKRFFKKQLKDF